MMAIPFFMLSGLLMERGGVSQRLINLCAMLLDRLPGSMAIITVVASTFFGAISGSSPATVAAIGGITVPAMIRKGYDQKFAFATAAASGCLGSIIPPSIVMVTYGVATGTSISSLFLAGIWPGLLLAFGFVVYSLFVGFKNKYFADKNQASHSAGDMLRAMFEAIPAILMPVIILGGIYGGIFTPTEAGNVACVYGLLVGFFVYKELSLADMPEIFVKTVVNTSIIMFIMAAANGFGIIITRENVPVQLAAFITSVVSSPITFLLLVNIILIIVGTFMETATAIIILAPLLAPIAVKFGIDPLFFGLIMCINLVLGLITPPLGVNLFVSVSIAGKQMKDILGKYLLGYICVAFSLLFIFTYAPKVTLFLFNIVNG